MLNRQMVEKARGKMMSKNWNGKSVEDPRHHRSYESPEKEQPDRKEHDDKGEDADEDLDRVGEGHWGTPSREAPPDA